MQQDQIQDPNALFVWNISIALANLACAPLVRAAQIRQVRKDHSSKGWRPLAGVLSDSEGLLAGWRGYLARGITYVISDLYNSQFSNFNRFEYPPSILLFAPVTSLLLAPFYTIQINRTCDVGVPLSSVSARERESGETKSDKVVQKYDGFWDTFCQIYETKGISGFYTGFAPTTVKLLLVDCHLLAWLAISNAMGESDLGHILLSGGFVITRELITYPLDLVANLQMLDYENENLSFLERVQKITDEDGIGGLYHGFFSYDYLVGGWVETPLTTLIAFALTVIGEVSS